MGPRSQGPWFRLGGNAGYPFFAGQIDEVRLSNVVRYAAAFTPPAAPFAPDANTLALYHFDERNGQTAPDGSGNGYALTLGTTAATDTPDPEWVVSTAPIANPPANLEVTGGPATGTVTVTVSGRFRLVFDAAHQWQARAWYDLASNPARNLANSGDTLLDYNVLQAPLKANDGQWYDLADARNATITVRETRASQTILDTTWTWLTGDGDTLDVTATHTIGADGQWQVEAALTNQGATPRTFSRLRYAFSSVESAMAWQETRAADAQFFSQTRSAGPGPRPQLRVERGGGLGALASDRAGNRFWTVPDVTLAPGATWTQTGTNRIWPE